MGDVHTRAPSQSRISDPAKELTTSNWPANSQHSHSGKDCFGFLKTPLLLRPFFFSTDGKAAD